MLVLLGLVLGARGAATFLVQVANWCPLAANGSLVGFDLAVVFNKNPLVCYEPQGHRFVPCDQGLLREVATKVATGLNNGSAWVQRAQGRRRACGHLATSSWATTALRR
ncbi:HLA class II histocompatibility antigen, DM beta chain-like, partial [Aegotheles albertisi]